MTKWPILVGKTLQRNHAVTLSLEFHIFSFYLISLHQHESFSTKTGSELSSKCWLSRCVYLQVFLYLFLDRKKNISLLTYIYMYGLFVLFMPRGSGIINTPGASRGSERNMDFDRFPSFTFYFCFPFFFGGGGRGGGRCAGYKAA